jgi:lysyl-tRNA synthetase class 2
MASMKEYRDEQLEKIKRLQEKGINLYPAKSNRDIEISAIVDDFDNFIDKKVTVAGRMISFRQHGKLSFLDVQDGRNKIQIIIRSDDINSDYEKGFLGYKDIALLTRGDFVEISGTVALSKTNQQSINADNVIILTKVLRPLPDKLDDKETRLRRRYLDLSLNQEVRERFIRRSKFWQATRQFLLDEGFIEINVPVLEHTTGGADANPFVTHMDALDQDFYLRISHELPLKRLLGGGYEKVFDIGPRFRNENYSDEHLPEHVAMESYAAYQDYEDGMEMYERMIKYVTKETWGKLKFENVNGFEVDLDQPWPRIKYADIMREKFGVDVFNPNLDELKKILKYNGVELDGELNISRALDNVWKLIRRTSAGPFWMIHEPVEISPLAKIEPSDPRVTQRFHPVIGGSELGNGFSELNDPQDQLARFLEQQQMREAGDAEAMMLDIDFVEMLEYGMPPACGWGNSERNFWFFEGVSAREGVIFPNLRMDVDETTKKIYPDVNFEDKSKKETEPKVNENLIKSAPITDGIDFSIDAKIFDNYPDAAVGYLVTELPSEVNIIDKDYIDDALTALNDRGITADNLSTQVEVSCWREAFRDFGVKPSKYLSSVEALAKRALKGNPAKISPFIDVYNGASIKNLVPMGALDLDFVSGNIELRYGRDGESAELLGMDESVKVNTNQVIYSDDLQVLTWLWNHRDAKKTAVSPKSKRVVYFADSLIGEDLALTAISELEEDITQLGAKVIHRGVLSNKQNSLNNDLPESAIAHGTKKLYLEDWGKLNFEAEAISFEKDQEGNSVLVLDQTAFYPGGGGQPFDLGEITWEGGSLNLTEISRDGDGIVRHIGILEGSEPKNGTKINANINRARRELNNRLHCAGHLLDYGVKQVGLDWKSGKGSHFPGACYVRYDGNVDPEKYEEFRTKIETAINNYIQKGGKVDCKIVPSTQANKFSDYIPQTVLDSYQNVNLACYPDDFNICCGGTHVQDISEIGKVKITKIKKKDGKISLSYEIE